jgi:hypothetical protein
MTKNNSHTPEAPLTQNQNNAMSDDPGDGSRNAFNPGPVARTPAEKAPPQDAQDQDRIEEFGERGMGIAAKE